MRIDTLIGVRRATSRWVRATVVDALSFGYHVAVPAEFLSDRAIGPHDANRCDMGAKYAGDMPLAEVITSLSLPGGRP
jgi:maleamate amidohydrolase